MEHEGLVLVTVRKARPSSDSSLEKWVEPSYLEGTFYDLLAHLVDRSGDTLNSQYEKNKQLPLFCKLELYLRNVREYENSFIVISSNEDSLQDSSVRIGKSNLDEKIPDCLAPFERVKYLDNVQRKGLYRHLHLEIDYFNVCG